MAKKQKIEENVRAIPINYLKLVDDLSDQAFQFCADQLYPICNYIYLQREDFRRIDLKEKLVSLYFIPRDEKGRAQGSLNYYLFVLKLYFENFIKCKSGSVAEKYFSRAMELIESALSDNGTIEDVEDIVQIFIALFRTLSNRFDEIENYMAVGLNFDVFRDDADLLKKIWEHKKLVPNGIVVEKKGGLYRSFGSNRDKQNAIKMAYIYNVIFLCRCLQNRGVFAMEEE